MESNNATHLTRTEAAVVARELKAKGYRVTAKDCYEYTINVVRTVAGADPTAQREVCAVIDEARIVAPPPMRRGRPEFTRKGDLR